ncbi:DUF3305 domain-containing protein [Roseicyclus persicicus]|uniref:DUF3305 domain-containing protein n=1 Tax=Roseicyclus persicicus TaxID=2650661 RepID=A0A7X6JYH8_9RHOB|nr:DUF3305 domain-containing protein [Roseibacterium persicicum]NKX44489.1 DUF3305 domain-containing protein [Roseibacterium persicicum]
MPREIIRIGVVAERRPPVTRWSTGELRPLLVLPVEPATPPGTRLGTEGGVETWYLGGRDMVLWSGDAGHHRDNLMSGRPSVWVALRGTDPARAEVMAVTVDPYEGEGLASDPELIVDAVPMPEPVARAVAAFSDRHFVDMPFKKRKRLPADPNSIAARAPRVLQPEDKWENRKGRRSDP